MCSVNVSAKGWTAALSCGNSKFVRFGLNFSGTLSDNSKACRYQGCVIHVGKTTIPVAWSPHIFLMTFVGRLNGGNIYMEWWLQFIEKASTEKEAYFPVCWSDWQIRQFLVYMPKVSQTALYIFGFNCHSVLFWNFLEFLSASEFSLTGMCTALQGLS